MSATETLPIPQIINPPKVPEFPVLPKELETFRKIHFSAIPLEVQKNLKQFNNKFTALMQRYRGLGLVEVLFVDQNNKYFTAMLGGANGYDRDENYTNLQSLIPETYTAANLLIRLGE